MEEFLLYEKDICRCYHEFAALFCLTVAHLKQPHFGFFMLSSRTCTVHHSLEYLMPIFQLVNTIANPPP
jgi:hypothetical protein